MKRTLLGLLALLCFVGCTNSSRVKVELPGGKASVTLPSEPKQINAKLPLKIYRGDPTKSTPPKIVTVKPGEKKPPGLWKEYPYEVKVTTFEIKDIRYSWGAKVFEFPPEAVKELENKVMEFARVQMIPPGHYVLQDETSRTFNTLPGLDISGRHSRGESQIDGRIILRGNTVYAVHYQGAVDRYPKELAKEIVESLQVEP